LLLFLPSSKKGWTENAHPETQAQEGKGEKSGRESALISSARFWKPDTLSSR